MDEQIPEWRRRLIEVVEKSGRSTRELSMAAGLGQNYLSQHLGKTARKPRQMGVEDLLKVLALFEPDKAQYVIEGLHPDRERAELVALFADWTKGEVEEAIAVFRTFRDSVPRRAPRPADRAVSD